MVDRERHSATSQADKGYFESTGARQTLGRYLLAPDRELGVSPISYGAVDKLDARLADTGDDHSVTGVDSYAYLLGGNVLSDCRIPMGRCRKLV